MGLLDDAIREHLDLKRRRGADPAEIDQAERDALGPVRRGPEGSDDADFDELAADDERFAHAEADEEDWDEPGAGEPAGAEDYEPTLEDEPEEPGGSSRKLFDRGDDPLESPTVARPAPEPEESPEATRADSGEGEDDPRRRGDAQPGSPAEGDTAEFDMAIEDEELGVAGDDVLEETPEFLQDTPDHDRLWFEQRPPKDFDFDG
jgi:hypothetical protein